MYFLIILESLKFGALLRNPAITFYVLCHNFSTFCYPLFSIFRKIFMAFTMILMIFFFFFFKKILISFTSFFSPFFSFLERFNICFYSLEISATEFSSSESSLSDSLAEISISLIIYLGIFFSLTTCLHSSKKAWG